MGEIKRKIFDTFILYLYESQFLKSFFSILILQPLSSSQKLCWQGARREPGVSEWVFTEKRLVEWATYQGKIMLTLIPAQRGTRFGFISVQSLKKQNTLHVCTGKFEDCCHSFFLILHFNKFTYITNKKKVITYVLMALEKQDRKQMPLDISPPHLPALILLPVLMLILFSQSACRQVLTY